MSAGMEQDSTAEFKSCCAAVYESAWAPLLLGETFHPGGLALTEQLGRLLGLGPGQTVLDVASGPGTPALHLARVFGCRAVGIDYSRERVEQANQLAREAGLETLVSFRQGDADRLPIEDDSIDAIICECAFCTFPDKPTAAHELARVLRTGGRIGLSDVTRTGPLPSELESLLGTIACLGSAQSAAEYTTHLHTAGFRDIEVETHDEALVTMVNEIRRKLVGAELLARLGQLTLPVGDLAQARRLAQSAAASIEAGKLGYALLTATRA